MPEGDGDEAAALGVEGGRLGGIPGSNRGGFGSVGPGGAAYKILFIILCGVVTVLGQWLRLTPRTIQ